MGIDQQTATDSPETETKSPFPYSDEQMAELMFRTPLNNALLCNKGQESPDVAIFQHALSLLPKHIGELVASNCRHALTKAIEQRQVDAITPTTTREKILNFFGKSKKPEIILSEIQWIDEHGDPTSYSMQALKSDLLMALGREDEAVTTYEAALRLVRDQEIAVME